VFNHLTRGCARSHYDPAFRVGPSIDTTTCAVSVRRQWQHIQHCSKRSSQSRAPFYGSRLHDNPCALEHDDGLSSESHHVFWAIPTTASSSDVSRTAHRMLYLRSGSSGVPAALQQQRASIRVQRTWRRCLCTVQTESHIRSGRYGSFT
jgi:hypothetical protein